MVRYATVPSKRWEFQLPSTPGALVWGPGELDYWDETRVLSRSQKTEINPLTNQPLLVVDGAVFEYELLHVALEHPDSGWNLEDLNGAPYERNTQTINTIFSKGDTKSDRRAMLDDLAKIHFPDMAKQQQMAKDAAEKEKRAEGNDHGPESRSITSGNGLETLEDGTLPSRLPTTEMTPPIPSLSTIGSTTTPTEA